jgi:hypothetical protein
MELKTIFELICCSHHTLCNLVFLNFSFDKSYSKNTRSRIIYCCFFVANIFFWFFLRTDMEGFLQMFFERYKCAIELDFLTCFEVNMLLRNSFSLVLFFSFNAFFVVSRNKYSIYYNEKLWVLKLLLWVFCFVAAMSFGLYFMFAFAIFSKYLSIVIMVVQLIIVHDSIVIMINKSILPYFGTRDRCRPLKLIIGYILPSILILTLIAFNFIKFSTICSVYMVVTLITVIMSVLLLAVNLMTIQEASIISSLWFIVITQVLLYSMQASTGVKSCLNKETGALSATWQAILWDTLISKCI